jgi:PAS domain-containing protein
MYKLVVIDAPEGFSPRRGESYALDSGKTTIGRESSNGIVLPSRNVSKQHCALELEGSSHPKVLLRDLRSSNGTFVNGVMAAHKVLAAGDRISVGEFVFELKKSQSQARRPHSNFPAAHLAQVLPFPSSTAPSGGSELHAPAPKDLKGKLFQWFELRLMPRFYHWNEKYEWKFLAMGLFGVSLMGAVLLAMDPVLTEGAKALKLEIQKRAKFMARQVVDQNSAILAQGHTTRLDLGRIPQEPGVRLVALVDMDQTILMPSAQANRKLTTGPEALMSVAASKIFRNESEQGIVREVLGGTRVIAIEPLRTLNPKLGRNEVRAMAIVSLDTSQSLLALGDSSMQFMEAMMFSCLLGGIAFLILYRITLKPFEVLQTDLDRVLKGEAHEIKQNYRFEELNPVWNILVSLVSRVPKGPEGMSTGLGEFHSRDEWIEPLKLMADRSPTPACVCDQEKRILHFNESFASMTQWRLEESLGQELWSQSRDEGFEKFLKNLLEQSFPGGNPVEDMTELSGTNFRFEAVAFGISGSIPKAYLVVAQRGDG